MKERVDSAKMLNGPGTDSTVPAGGVVSKLDAAEIKMEVKDEDNGRKSTDSGPPSRKIPNGDSDTMSVKSEDNNNKRIKLEKKADNGKLSTENGKPGSVGRPDSRKSSPHTPQPASVNTLGPGSGPNTPSSTLGCGMPPSGNIPQQQMMHQPQAGLVTSHEPPFMQQQSEIFVFSTALANQAAEGVRMGQCKTIIQFHMEHPNTKAFLQKNPLKSSNFRHGCPQSMMGGMKGQQMGSGMVRMPGPTSMNWGPQGPGPQGPGNGEDPSMMGAGGPGGMMPNGQFMGPRMMGGPGSGGWSGGPPHMQGMGPAGCYPGGGPGGPPMMDMEAEMMMGPGGVPHPGGMPNNPLSVSQVPDENLTVEQRQHRSKGLAQLTKIHQMLMGGGGNGANANGQPGGGCPPMGPGGPPQQMGGPEGGPGMYPPGMMNSPQAMMQQHQQAMMSQGGGMMPPHPGMMSPQQQQQMMAQQGMSPYGPRGPPGMGPPGMNGKDQFQAQHDWYQIQRDFYMEKQHRMQQQMAAAGRGGPMPPHMEPGPPPSYYSSISQKHTGMGPHMPGGPPSPGSMNGMRMPMGPHGPPHMGMEGAEGMGGMYGPPHMNMEPMPGMYPPHGMPPQGPMDPGFDPTIPGSMPPGMGPGGGPMRHHGPMRPGHPGHMMGGPNGMMPAGMKPGGLPANVTLHRAGNPEQFNPETMGGVVPPPSSNSSKPPPSYAQAQKRKRGDNDADDSGNYAKGNLQQTPSPTKIHYHLSQFEGQELTITKQLNTAFVGDDMATTNSGTVTTSSVVSSSGAGPHNFNSHSSPLHGPGSNKGPHSNSSQTSMHNSPSVPTGPTGPSPHHHQGPPTPLSSSAPPPSCSGANMRLSHFDPSGGPSNLSNGISSAPHTPNPKLSSSSSSTLSNITSASLANLAKGVENLSNQMQQNMMQGGPFHSIQVQGQMASTGSNGGNSSNTNGSNSNPNSNGGGLVNCPPTTTSATTTSAPSSSLPSHPSSSLSTSLSSANPTSSSTPSAHPPASSQSPSMNMPNSSFMNNSGPGGAPHPMNSYLNMPQGMGPAGCDMPGMPNGPRPPTPIMSHHAQMAQTQGMLAAAALGPMGGPGASSPGMQQHMGPHGMGGPPSSHQMPMGGPPQHIGPHMGQQPMAGPGMPPQPHHHRHNSSSSHPATPPIMNKPGQFTSPPLSHGQMGMSGVGSPSFPPAATTNSNSSSGPSVQIQQKGQNTIQYLPANPPASSTVPAHPQQHPPVGAMGGGGLGPKPMPEMGDYGVPRFPSPMHAGGMSDGKSHPSSSTLQYFPSSSPSGPRGPMSSAMSAAAAMGPEFANQATIAMHQSASMMRSSSIPDLHAMQGMGGAPGPMDNSTMGATGPMHPGGPSPMMGGPVCPDMHPTGPGGPMRPGQSPMRPMHPGMAPHGGLECVSPIPGMGGYMNSGPTIEQAQAQAQAHAAMMMQGGPQMPTSSPHMPPSGGPSPHMAPHGSAMHSSMPPHSGPMPGHSPHGAPMPGHSPHNGPMPGHSPHGAPMPGSIPGPMPVQSPHSQMVPPCSMQGPSPHCPMPPSGPPHPHSSMSGPMPGPHGHMGGGPPMHGPGGMPRHPGMGNMMGPGPGMYGGGPGAMQGGYPGYQPDYYPSGPPRGPPRQMMGPGMMAGPGGQPYGMMSNMPGPS